MVKVPKSKGPLRRILKGIRVTLLMALFLLVIPFVYIHNVGVPPYIKVWLFEPWEKTGHRFEVGDIYWRWPKTIEALNVKLEKPGDPQFPSLLATMVEIDLRFPVLNPRHVGLKNLKLKNGVLSWKAINLTNAGQTMVVSNLQLNAGFSSRNLLTVRDLTGRSGGLQIAIEGHLTNWNEIISTPATKPGPVTLEKIQKLVSEVSISEKSSLLIGFRADSRDLTAASVNIAARIPAISGPWGKARELNARLVCSAGEIKDLLLTAAQIESPLVHGNLLHLSGTTGSLFQEDELFHGDFRFRGQNIALKNFESSSVQLHSSGRFSFSPPYFQELRNEGKLRKLKSYGNDCHELRFTADLDPGIHAGVLGENTPLTRLFEFRNWKADLFFNQLNLKEQGLSFEELKLAGFKSGDRLTLQNAEGKLFGGDFTFRGSLATNGLLEVRGKSGIDPKRISHMLTVQREKWLKNFSWESPPQVDFQASMQVPTHHVSSTNWLETAQESLFLNGQVKIGALSYGGIPFPQTESAFNYSNRVWTVPHLASIRPEGRLDVNYWGDDSTGRYRLRVVSQFDPKIASTVLTNLDLGFFDQLDLSTPPRIRAQIEGEWGTNSNIRSVEADIAVTNFVYRGTHVDTAVGNLTFSNSLLRATDVKLTRADRMLRFEEATYNTRTSEGTVTNGFCNMDPILAAGLIHQGAVEAIEPFKFARIPTVYADGAFKVGERNRTDIHFNVEGEQFSWENLGADWLRGDVYWRGQTMMVTNIQARAYLNGNLAGWTYFDFRPRQGNEFIFELAFADVDLQTFLRSSRKETNSLSGVVSGLLAVDSANTGSIDSWQGHGRVNLREGFLWEFPIFGLFSPVLNTLLPGLGSSKAKEASANFKITNSVISTQDLEVRSKALRLAYRGSVDFHENVNARVEGEIFKDAWLVGKILSTMLLPLSKLFEYKVTGTLSNPVAEPLHIPKFLMQTLRPINTLKELMREKDEKPPGLPPEEGKKP